MRILVSFLFITGFLSAQNTDSKFALKCIALKTQVADQNDPSQKYMWQLGKNSYVITNSEGELLPGRHFFPPYDFESYNPFNKTGVEFYLRHEYENFHCSDVGVLDLGNHGLQDGWSSISSRNKSLAFTMRLKNRALLPDTASFRLWYTSEKEEKPLIFTSKSKFPKNVNGLKILALGTVAGELPNGHWNNKNSAVVVTEKNYDHKLFYLNINYKGIKEDKNVFVKGRTSNGKKKYDILNINLDELKHIEVYSRNVVSVELSDINLKALQNINVSKPELQSFKNDTTWETSKVSLGQLGTDTESMLDLQSGRKFTHKTKNFTYDTLGAFVVSKKVDFIFRERYLDILAGSFVEINEKEYKELKPQKVESFILSSENKRKSALTKSDIGQFIFINNDGSLGLLKIISFTDNKVDFEIKFVK